MACKFFLLIPAVIFVCVYLFFCHRLFITEIFLEILIYVAKFSFKSSQARFYFWKPKTML